jgi:hypothetical protein
MCCAKAGVAAALLAREAELHMGARCVCDADGAWLRFAGVVPVSDQLPAVALPPGLWLLWAHPGAAL